jgi:hypothetical protein
MQHVGVSHRNNRLRIQGKMTPLQYPHLAKSLAGGAVTSPDIFHPFTGQAVEP